MGYASDVRQARDYGLSKPNYRVFDKHPTINNEVPYYIKHGRITPKQCTSA
jgi:hypothetical protein